MNNKALIPAVICSRDIDACRYAYGTTGAVESCKTRCGFWKFFPDGGEPFSLLTDREVFFPGVYPAQASEPKPPYCRADLEQKLKREVSAVIEKDIMRILCGIDASAPDTGEKARVAELRKRLQRLQSIWSPSNILPDINSLARASAYSSALAIVDNIFGPENKP